MKKNYHGIWMIAACLLAASLFTTGCESTETEDAVIVITSDIDESNEVQLGQLTFTASLDTSVTNIGESLVLPLEWSVAKAGLGRIISTGGASAVYEATGLGVQSIQVRDQIGRTGVKGFVQVEVKEDDDEI
ncbi:MAG TPA: hypothetical protein PKE12_06100 [Kiritimatiellia bacterium]|nr:hypothetical protein [Kiritimatiellia bacterium]